MIQEKMTKYDLCWNKNKNLAKKKSAFAIIENKMSLGLIGEYQINEYIYILTMKAEEERQNEVK